MTYIFSGTFILVYSLIDCVILSGTFIVIDCPAFLFGYLFITEIKSNYENLSNIQLLSHETAVWAIYEVKSHFS